MRIAVLGATGRTGSVLLALAAQRGHEVIAVVRNPAAVVGAAEVRVADARDAEALSRAISGADAVAFCVGPRDRAAGRILEEGMTATLAAMSAAGVRRLVAISASGPFIDGDDPLMRIAKPIVQRVFAEQFSDFAAMEPLIHASTTDWTIVRPPQLKDGRPRGRYRSRLDGSVWFGMTIRRADLAAAVLDALESKSIWQTISVAS